MSAVFYTIEQIAEMLQVDEKIVHEWIVAGVLSSVRIGHVIRISENQLNTFLNKHSEGDTGPLDSTGGELEEPDYMDLVYGNQMQKIEIQEKAGEKRGRKPTGKYDKLKDYLGKRITAKVKMSFQEIESLMGSKLPGSARTQRAYWANDKGHSQARAWMSAGWMVVRADLNGETIEFERSC